MQIAYGLLILSMLIGGIAFALHDLRTRKVPNKALLPYLALAAFTVATQGAISSTAMSVLLGSLFAGILAGSVMLIIALTTKGIGGGDIKFLAIFALPLGMEGLTFTMIAMAIILGVYLLITFIISKIKKSPMPKGGAFVPFIVGAAAPYMIAQAIISFI